MKLPSGGPNYSAYSWLGASMGRTYVHSTVERVVLAAYKALEQSSPKTTFVYAETGWHSGGRIRPHRTHQNGLSVDFMVPVLDQSGRSVPLPTGLSNKFGYDIEFGSDAKYREYRIDFDAIGEHLFQLHAAAARNRSGIALIIFEPDYLPQLFETHRGKWLQRNLNFMKKQAWVRHDEHYHVDFLVECKSL